MKKHTMKRRADVYKKAGRVLLMSALAVFVCLACCKAMEMKAYAKEQDFTIDAQIVSSSKDTYDIRVAVENAGADWEGIARLRIGDIAGISNIGYGDNCAYDTVISLPQGSAKQFVVRIPRNSYNINGGVQVSLISKNADVAAEKVFYGIWEEEEDSLMMGILSDDYSALTYLDMGGDKLYYYSDEHPIKLKELNQDNLFDSLEALTFLVIDRYNTGILTDAEIAAIDDWVSDGGVLIIGTGSYAEDTLNGFDSLGIECRAVYEPGKHAGKWNSVSNYVDWSKLHMAELVDTTGMYNDWNITLGMTDSQGDGVVGVLPYSLTELGGLQDSDYNLAISQSQRLFVYYLLDNASDDANSRYRSKDSSGTSAYTIVRLLDALGTSSNILNFGVLKFIIIVYVILVGPVSYLILRFLKKRDLYWAVVPAAALVGILLVFFAGRGFTVVSTQVYSVTVCNLAGRGDCKTYLHCYDAGHKEWDLCLAESYKYVGTQDNHYYGDSDVEYYYHVRKEGDRLFFGIKPTAGFEDSYFCAGRSKVPKSEDQSIGSDVPFTQYTITSVTNNTEYDFKYFAVLDGKTATVYKDLKAGETSRLNGKEEVFDCELEHYYYDYISEADRKGKKEDMDIISALGIGVVEAYSQMNGHGVVIVGVTDDWEKAVDDSCNEVSYGCLYMIQGK